MKCQIQELHRAVIKSSEEGNPTPGLKIKFG